MIVATRKVLAKSKKNKIRYRVEWLRRCDKCGNEKWLTEHYKAFHAITHLCRTCSNQKHGAKRRGLPSPFKGQSKSDIERKLGSRYVDQFGYLQQYVGPNFPGHRAKYYPVHKLVMEQALGRKLERGEVVHHLDGDKSNNEPTNLVLCASMSEHRRMHRQLELLAFVLVQEGCIQYCSENKKYFYAPPDSNVRLESGELRGSLSQHAVDMVILSQAPSIDGEGATTIPQGSRGQAATEAPDIHTTG